MIWILFLVLAVGTVAVFLDPWLHDQYIDLINRTKETP